MRVFLCVCAKERVCVKLTEGMGEDHGRVEESDLGVFVCAHIFKAGAGVSISVCVCVPVCVCMCVRE